MKKRNDFSRTNFKIVSKKKFKRSDENAWFLRGANGKNVEENEKRKTGIIFELRSIWDDASWKIENDPFRYEENVFWSEMESNLFG